MHMIMVLTFLSIYMANLFQYLTRYYKINIFVYDKTMFQ